MIGHYKLASIAAITLIWCGEPAWAWQKTLFMHCHTKSAVRLSATGSLETDPLTSNIEFTVDVQSGAVRLKYAREAMQWIILRAGDAENDTILVGQITEPTRMADLVLRIRDWASQPTITFTKIALTSVSSGTCTQL
jgi:hypothetical protein